MKKTVEESGILDEYPTVRVGDCSKLPDIDKLLPLARVTSDPKLSALETGPGAVISETDIYYDPSKNVFGTQLYLKDSKPEMTTWKKATAGGIVALGNRYFCMTVAHVFTDEAKFTSGNRSDSEFEFDIGQNESEDEENELIETTSRASITPEPDDYASSNSSKIISDAPESSPSVSHEELQQNSDDDEAKDQFVVIDDVEKSKTLEAVGRLVKLSTNGPHPDLDYALIEIQRPDFPTFNCIQLSETTLLVPKQVVKIKSQNTSIITATGSSGVLKGILSGTPSFLKSPSSTIFQEVWTVRLDGKLAKGDSGSWVMDSETGALLGHIVAGSPDTGVAYMTPSIQIFTDLRTQFGGEFRLSISAADESTKTATDELSLIGPGESVNTKEEVGLLLNESGQHDSGHPRLDTRRRKKAGDLDLDSDLESSDQLYLYRELDNVVKANEDPDDDFVRLPIHIANPNNLHSASRDGSMPHSRASDTGLSHNGSSQGDKGKRKTYDNGDSKEESSPKRRLNSNGGKLMICPYYRRNPTKHAQCWKYELAGYNAVKQHVLRKHAMPEYYCSICWCPFKTDTEWRAHTTPADCQEAPRPDYYEPDLIDRDGRDYLKTKLPSTCNDDEKKWRWLFRFIFKEYHEPKSIWREDPKYEAATLLGHDFGFGPEEIIGLLEKNSKTYMPVSDRTPGVQRRVQRQTGFVESHAYTAHGDATYFVPDAARIRGPNAEYQVSPTQFPTASGQGPIISGEAAPPRLIPDAFTAQMPVAALDQYPANNTMTSTYDNSNHHFYSNLDPSLLDAPDTFPSDSEWTKFDSTNGNSSLSSPGSRET